jgi:ferrochelatase
MENSTGVLLINTGTPSDPTSKSIRKYLEEFLSDQRIVQLPRFIWMPILYTFILPFRPKNKVKDYKKIWTEEGSPLLVYTKRLLQKLKNKQSNKKIIINIAMRYGEPNIKTQLEKLKQKKITNLIIIPLFPQYSFTTTESIKDKIKSSLIELNWKPTIKFIKEFYKEKLYIDSIAKSIKDNWQKKGKNKKLIFSYHGLPIKYIKRGDTYYHSCVETSLLIATKLKLKKDEYITSFHSRFGFGEWTKPYTENLMVELPKIGCKSISIISPSFSIDCLETLEEIKIQFKEKFIKSGGEKFNYIPCLNETDNHVLIIEKLLAN